MRVVITGATGNVGTSLVELLEEDPDVEKVIGLSRRTPHVVSPKTSWRSADLATDDITSHFEGADAVVHLAWQLRPSHRFDYLERVNVRGSQRVFEAAINAGVSTVIHASSVGVYSPGPKSPVDESHPHHGVSTSTYSRQKAAVEQQLDAYEEQHPEVRWVRMRPGLIFKRGSAEHIRRLFFGSLYPIALLRRKPLPILPNTPGLIVNVVHTTDVARALQTALKRDVRGPFNLATGTPLDITAMADIADVPTVPTPPKILRAIADFTWRAHLQPTEAGWIDLALQTPLLDSSRADQDLDWTPVRSAEDTFAELIDGLMHGGHLHTPPLERAKHTGTKTAVNNARVLARARMH